MWLFDSLIGYFIVQTFAHSLIAAMIIERAIVIWDIRSHLAKFRYRAMILVLPVLLFPLFIYINPARYSFLFRSEKALLNINNWLSLDLWALLPVRYLLLLVFAGTSAVFFLQEIGPIMRDAFSGSNDDNGRAPGPREAITLVVSEISKELGIRQPKIRMLEIEDPVIYTSGTHTHTLMISTGLLKTLDQDQITSAVTHELAHIQQGSNIINWIIFMLRILMFFNPVSLLVFRRIVQDDEHICDDIAVSVTKNPLTLASALRTFCTIHEDTDSVGQGKISRIKDEIENHSHNLLLKERILRLEQISQPNVEGFELDKFALTTLAIILITYYVV